MMDNYVISKKELLKWCSISKEDLLTHTDKKMDLVINDDIPAMLNEVGDIMADTVLKNNRLGKHTCFVLPGGPDGQFIRFAERVNKEKISLKNLYIFHMDTWLDWEFRLFPLENERFSCESKMTKKLYNKIDCELNVPLSQRFFPNPSTPDLFDDRIEELGGIDLLLGGVGCKGLVAFNEEPQIPLHKITIDQFANSKTRIVTLHQDTIIAYGEREFGACFDVLPPYAFTIGMKSMLTAKKAIFIVTTGSWKQTVVRVALFSPPTMEYPVTLFSAFVPECTIYCDNKTATHEIEIKYKNSSIF